MANYWTAKPVIVQDKTGTEVRLKKGFGIPISLEESDKGQASKVTIDTGHPRFKSNGWVPKDDPLYAVVEQAITDGTPLEFIIENKRRKNVDKSIPIEDLLEGVKIDGKKLNPTETLSNSLVAIRLEDGEWLKSPLAVTSLEDPDDLSNQGSNQNNNVAQTPTDPSDPGSFSVAVPVTVLGYVHEYFNKRDDAYEADERIKFLVVKSVLKICNEIQMKVCKLDKPDMGAFSHVRARQIVFLVLEQYLPVNVITAKDSKKLQAWEEQVEKKAVDIWEWSISESVRVSGLDKAGDDEASDNETDGE